MYTGEGHSTQYAVFEERCLGGRPDVRVCAMTASGTVSTAGYPTYNSRVYPGYADRTGCLPSVNLADYAASNASRARNSSVTNSGSVYNQ